MRILSEKAKNQKCCKCDKQAVHIVSHDDKIFYVCEFHKPSQITMLRADGHIANLKGKEYVLYAGLLDMAHRNGLKAMECEIMELDKTNQFCLIKATVTGDRGTFVAHGDASPENTGKMVLSAYIRMAETRAYARCLRLYCGIGMTCREELPPQS
tara:strand:- start:1465 stop:1929 length:465 start_codon:yes stop_codon:yes gene_type:complete